MKNKKIQIPIILIACIIALAGVYKLLDSVCYPLVEAKAEQYLCDKYDAQPEEFELVDYNQAHLFWEEYKIFFQKPVWIDFSFEYIYNDRHFFVNRENGEFYDDYQLEDIEQWCTKWLQANVDSKITGFNLDIMDVTWYQNKTDKYYSYVITEEDSEKFLNEMSKNGQREFCFVYYYDSTINEFIQQDNEKNDIAQKLNKLFNSNDKYRALCTSSNIVFTMSKTNVEEWVRFSEKINKGE